MKILHIIPDLHGGGGQKFCIDLCNELSKEHDVTICSLFDIEEHMFMADALDSNVKRIILHKKLGFDISIFFKINTLLKTGEYDIVNTHLRALFYSSLAIPLNKKNYFHTVHSMADKETGKIQRLIYGMLFKIFKVIPIGISKKVLDSIHSEYGKQFSTLIENGTKQLKATDAFENTKLEIESYKKSVNTKVFLTIGRIAKEKNHAMLINVFHQLIAENEDVILLIIGNDPLSGNPTLNQLQLIAKPEIHFLGEKQNIVDYLLCSDAFCLTSLYEGLPITLIESMSQGIIPICTPAGGIVNVIKNNNNGFLSTDFTEKSYYEKIKKFMSLTVKEKTILSANCIQDFNKYYDIAITSKKYIKLYKGKNP
jgi:glycosyltransferase involved in cell wall biosynthesis